jgi:Superfamily I DNA and RNA helicases
VEQAELAAAIIDVLRDAPAPLLARETASELTARFRETVTRNEVNSCLYGPLQSEVVMDADYRWALASALPIPQLDLPRIPAGAVFPPMTAKPRPGPPDHGALTLDQAAVVSAAPDARLMVTAPAGSGKTHVLVARAEILIEDHEVSVGDGLLMLSFSRAAVQEVRRRAADRAGAARHLTPVTFDAFASRLLRLYSESESWHSGTYDTRMVAARRLLEAREDDSELDEFLSSLQHVLVDEVQDLVGIRAEFTLELLSQIRCGFTLFGDPAQSIYGFQLRQQESEMTSPQFYSRVRELFADGIIEHAFVDNYRATTRASRTALALGTELADPQADYESIGARLLTKLQGLGCVALTTVEAHLRTSPESKAVLCRYNSSALAVSGELRRRAIPHALRRKSDDRAVARWVADVLSHATVTTLGRTRFEELWREHSDPAVGLTCDEAWSQLRQLSLGGVKNVDLGSISARIRLQDIPDELNYVPESLLVVSSIHRAKGLEFNDVFLVYPNSTKAESPEELAEETRTLYVAMTRVRRRLVCLADPHSHWYLRSRGVADDRCIRLTRGSGGGRALAMEVRGSDVDPDCPGGKFPLAETAARETQAYLATRVHPGDAVTLHLLRSSAGLRPRAYYSVVHEETPIGATSEHFGHVLARVLRPWSGSSELRFPTRIEDVYVDVIDSVAGIVGTAKQVGLGSIDLWLRPRVVGLGRFVWNGEPEAQSE